MRQIIKESLKALIFKVVFLHLERATRGILSSATGFGKDFKELLSS
jgi:hypothetical protein